MFFFFFYFPFFFYKLTLSLRSSEPKAQGELLVSKGDTPASVVRRHASTIVFFYETSGQIYFKFSM
jgi:hypothetical protein